MFGLARAVAAGLLGPALLMGAPQAAFAHGLLIGSSPKPDEVVKAAPPRLFLRFNSRIEKALSKVTLIGPEGRPVPLPASAPEGAPNDLAVPLPDLEPARYVVRWKVLSADGHVTEGAFRFTVAPRP